MKILHLSDIHFSDDASDAAEPDGYYRDQVVAKVRQESSIGKFDAIIVSGDIAAKGKASEFVHAAAWIKQICSISGCPEKHVYLVPGNHDVDRSVIGERRQVYLAQDAIVNSPNKDAALKQTLADVDTGPALFRPIEAYNKFAEPFECDVGPSEHGMWVRYLDLEHGYRLKIFGLNSVLLSSCRPRAGNDQPRQNLMLGSWQTSLRKEPRDVTAVICHHPPSWLLDNDRVEKELKNRAHLQFLGHKHDRDVEVGRAHVRFGAGAINPERNEPGWEPGFNVINIGVEGSASDGYELSIDATVWAWQENPDQFRPHRDHDGKEQWHATLSLQAIPATEPDVSPERVNPPLPVGGGGIAKEDIQQFWSLTSATRKSIVTSLNLLSDDEARLPERYRYANIFKRATTTGQAAALIAAIKAGGN